MTRRVLLVAAAVLGLGAAAVDSARPHDLARVAADVSAERDHITAVELAEAIVANRPLRLIDLRSEHEFAAFHIPGATRADLEQVAAMDLPRATTIVLYSEGAPHAAQAWVLLRLRGYRDVRFLREGIYEWIARVHEPKLASDATAAERADFERRAALSRFFGGQPHVDVPRSELPAGYWASETPAAASVKPAQAMVAAIRRRGC